MKHSPEDIKALKQVGWEFVKVFGTVFIVVVVFSIIGIYIKPFVPPQFLQFLFE